MKKCPNCDDVGWYIVTNGNGEPEQEQCRFCYEEPDSIFNYIINKLCEIGTAPSTIKIEEEKND